MGVHFPKRFRWIACFLFLCVALVFSIIGRASLAQVRDEARIRNYFNLAADQPLQNSIIRAALLSQFPVGTQATSVKSVMAERGLGKDAKSMMWQSETNRWLTSRTLCCGPYDYSDGWISMRRIAVAFNLDENQKVKEIDVECFSYSL